MKFYILFNPPNPTVYPDAEVNREQLTTEVNNDIAPGREFEALGSWEENTHTHHGHLYNYIYDEVWEHQNHFSKNDLFTDSN